MSVQNDAMNTFQKAKTEFIKRAREATATEGIIDGGEEMEKELVSNFTLNNFLFLSSD